MLIFHFIVIVGKVNYSSIDHYSFLLMVSLEIDLECNYVLAFFWVLFLTVLFSSVLLSSYNYNMYICMYDFSR